MSSTAKSKLTNLLTLFAILFTVFQGVIPTMPITDPGTITIVSAVTMFLVAVITAWKQYVSEEVANKALRPTLFIALIATLGAANELFNVISISETTGQWIRFAITLLTALLNAASKILWPTDFTQSRL